MHPQLESIFDEAENRYLHSEELTILSQYVNSLPERLETYRKLRDTELDIMQKVADRLQAEMPNGEIAVLELSIKNALLLLRHCSMGMLVNDVGFVQNRLLNWIGQTARVYNTQTVDARLYRLLNQQLAQVFTPKQLSLLQPVLSTAQAALLNQHSP